MQNFILLCLNEYIILNKFKNIIVIYIVDAVIVEGLRKNYGKIEAVKGISFKVEKNKIFGLIGPNGVGKTTVLRILATILKKSGGRAGIFGYEIGKDDEKIREMISYLPEEAGAYKNMRGIEYLKFMASFFENCDLEMAVEIANLGKRINDKIETYSKGMVRRLLMARALMMGPRLAILDEPTSGLDVLNAYEIREIIKNFAMKGTTFLISSHNMLEVEYLCDEIALMNNGVIVESGKPRDLIERYGAKNIEEVFMKVIK